MYSSITSSLFIFAYNEIALPCTFDSHSEDGYSPWNAIAHVLPSARKTNPQSGFDFFVYMQTETHIAAQQTNHV